MRLCMLYIFRHRCDEKWGTVKYGTVGAYMSGAVQFKVDAKSAKALRDQTGAGMMDAKKALMETQGDVAQAVEWLRKKGLSSADKKSGRVASEGVIAAYIHAGSRCGIARCSVSLCPYIP